MIKYKGKEILLNCISQINMRKGQSVNSKVLSFMNGFLLLKIYHGVLNTKGDSGRKSSITPTS